MREKLLAGFAFALCVLLAAAPQTLAQKKVKTETIKEPATNPAKAQKRNGTLPEILRDVSALPEPVRKLHERILVAARNGDLAAVAAIMKEQKSLPTFSVGGDPEPVQFWKNSFPDSDGLEVLSSLIEVLESPFVLIEKGTPNEVFVWPYFHAIPLEKLTAPQRVELFRLVTAFDYKEMQKFGAYNFFRVGISPDGAWQFFIAGD